MKKFIPLFVVLAIASLAFTSCKEPESVLPTSIEINELPDEVLEVGKTYQLTLTVVPEDSSNVRVEWASSDTDVATISNSGKLTTLKEGFTKITATVGTLTSSIEVVIYSNEPQDYTSFVFWHDEPVTLTNCVVGYFDEEGYCWKIAEIGDLSQGIKSDEMKINDDSITEVYLFTDYAGCTMNEDTYILEKNKKNLFKMRSDSRGILVDKNNPKEYPQERDAI